MTKEDAVLFTVNSGSHVFWEDIYMDIGALSLTLSDTRIRNDISMAVLDKSMDVEKQAGEAMIDMMNRSMMEKSVNPNVGSGLDISI